MMNCKIQVRGHGLGLTLQDLIGVILADGIAGPRRPIATDCALGLAVFWLTLPSNCWWNFDLQSGVSAAAKVIVFIGDRTVRGKKFDVRIHSIPGLCADKQHLGRLPRCWALDGKFEHGSRR